MLLCSSVVVRHRRQSVHRSSITYHCRRRHHSRLFPPLSSRRAAPAARRAVDGGVTPLQPAYRHAAAVPGPVHTGTDERRRTLVSAGCPPRGVHRRRGGGRGVWRCRHDQVPVRRRRRRIFRAGCGGNERQAGRSHTAAAPSQLRSTCAPEAGAAAASRGGRRLFRTGRRYSAVPSTSPQISGLWLQFARHSWLATSDVHQHRPRHRVQRGHVRDLVVSWVHSQLVDTESAVVVSSVYRVVDVVVSVLRRTQRRLRHDTDQRRLLLATRSHPASHPPPPPRSIPAPPRPPPQLTLTLIP